MGTIKIIKAKKEHICNVCKKHIQVGDKLDYAIGRLQSLILPEELVEDDIDDNIKDYINYEIESVKKEIYEILYELT